MANDGLKQHYKKMLDVDTPFIETFGTIPQKTRWRDGIVALDSLNDKKTLIEYGNLMGSIRDSVHKSNENNTEYRLFFLQHGPHTYEQLERDLGKEVADAVQHLRDNEHNMELEKKEE